MVVVCVRGAPADQTCKTQASKTHHDAEHCDPNPDEEGSFLGGLIHLLRDRWLDPLVRRHPCDAAHACFFVWGRRVGV